MALSRSRKLDLVGVGLVLVVVAFAAMVGFGTLTATSDGGGDDVPDVEWNVEQVDDSTIEIEHVNGEPIPPDELVVNVDGNERTGVFGGVARPGDTATITVTDPVFVQIYWSGPTGTDTLMERQRF